MPKVHLEKEVSALAMGLHVTFEGVASLIDEVIVQLVVKLLPDMEDDTFESVMILRSPSEGTLAHEEQLDVERVLKKREGLEVCNGEFFETILTELSGVGARRCLH
jgi:hypothetical protein